MATKLVLEMTAADAARDAVNRMLASGSAFALARALQRAAFSAPEYAAQRATYVGEFRPAPLYLTQATAVFTNPETAEDIRAALPKKEV